MLKWFFSLALLSFVVKFEDVSLLKALLKIIIYLFLLRILGISLDFAASSGGVKDRLD